MSHLSHLECGHCGTTQDADRIWNLCPKCGKPLLARYDLEAARTDFPREKLVGRPESLWPVQDAPTGPSCEWPDASRLC